MESKNNLLISAFGTVIMKPIYEGLSFIECYILHNIISRDQNCMNFHIHTQL